MDGIPAPNVQTIARYGNFKLVIYAYRALTEEETRIVFREWLRNSKRKSIPKTGSETVITHIGFDE